jgi:hypothetical protein
MESSERFDHSCAELLWRKEFGVNGLGPGSRWRDSDAGIQRESDGRQADFRAAGLIAKFERETLRAKRSARKRGDWKTESDGVFVNV